MSCDFDNQSPSVERRDAAGIRALAVLEREEETKVNSRKKFGLECQLCGRFGCTSDLENWPYSESGFPELLPLTCQ